MEALSSGGRDDVPSDGVPRPLAASKRPAPILPPQFGNAATSGSAGSAATPSTSGSYGLPPRTAGGVGQPIPFAAKLLPAGSSPVTPVPKGGGTPTAGGTRITSITPPGTRRTSLFLSSIRADMGLQTLPARSTSTSSAVAGGGDASRSDSLTSNMFGGGGAGSSIRNFGEEASPPLHPRTSFDDVFPTASSGMLDSGKLQRRNSFFSTTNLGSSNAVASTKSPGGSQLTQMTPMTPSTTGRSFIVSKRQTAFLLSVSALYGASSGLDKDIVANSAQERDNALGTGHGGGLHRDPSVASLATLDDGDDALLPGEDAKWARMLPTKRGDKVRLRLMSLHSGKNWAPLLLSTMLATFLERRTLITIGGERVPADLVADCTGDYGLGPEGTPSLEAAALTSQLALDGLERFQLSGGVNAGGLQLGAGDGPAPSGSGDTSPNKKFVSALVQSLSDVAARTGRRKDEHHEVSYIAKFSADHDARVSASPQFANPFYLDDPDITGERRRKRMHLRSYICTVISFADRRTEKKDINQQFFLRHPYLELRDIKLSHIRSIKTTLLQLCLSQNSPIELSSIAYAAWYWERLVTALQVTKQNRKLMVAVCVTLAVKFWESGNIARKVEYAWTKMEQLFGVDPATIKLMEFQVFAALEFTLLPPTFDVGRVYMERLLHIMNITVQEYYSRSFDLAIQWE